MCAAPGARDGEETGRLSEEEDWEVMAKRPGREIGSDRGPRGGLVAVEGVGEGFVAVEERAQLVITECGKSVQKALRARGAHEFVRSRAGGGGEDGDLAAIA